MDLTKISINRPVTTIITIFVVLMFGIVSYTRLPMDLYPSVDIPILVVATDYEGAGPKEIEELITKPIEQTLASVANVDNIQSISSSGSSTIIIEFVDDTDMDFASLDVREKIDLVENYLPENASTPIVISIDPNAEAIMTIGITSDYELDKMVTLLENGIISKFERVDGVGSVDMSGDEEKEIKVTLIPEKLEGYNISSQLVTQSLQAANIDLPVGAIEYGNKDMSIRVVGEYKSINDIRNTPIATGSDTIILSDVAIIEETYKEMPSYSYIDGKPGITLSIKKQSTANTVEVAKKLRAELERVQQENKDLTLINLFDSAKDIETSLSSVANAAILGMIFSVIVLFVFLRNVRSTLIIALSMPLAIVFTFVLMFIFNVSINLMSLAGLTLGVGMLVDSSIVVLENIYRHRLKGLSKKEGAYKGAKEVGLAVVASTLTTMAVFIPLLYVEGIISTMFNDLALTIVAALLAALIVAITIVPMLSSQLLNTDQVKHRIKAIDRGLDGWQVLLNKIDHAYEKVLNKALVKRKLTNVIMFVLFIGTLLLLSVVGLDLMPQLDQGVITIKVSLPKGSNTEKTFNVTNKVLEKVEKIEEDKIIYYTVASSGNSTINIDISKDKNRRDTEEVVEYIRGEIKDIPGANITLQANTMGMMNTGGKPIQLEVSGDDLDVLTDISYDIIDIISDIKGLRNVSSSVEEGIPEAQIIIDRERAMSYGLSIPEIAQVLEGYITGRTATQFTVDGTEIDVRVALHEEYVKNLENIRSLTIPTRTGTVTVDQIAEIKMAQTPTDINRNDGKRLVTIESDIYGISTGEAQQLINEELKNYSMPVGYSYDFGGDIEMMVDSLSSLGLALIMAIFLVYFVLAAQFESFINPFIIMFSVPYALTGAIAALFVTGFTLDMTALMGMIMLSGIVVNNAIVLMSYIIQLRQSGLTKEEAILKAGPTRLRPILMTTLTTVLAMIPVALGIGEGTEMISPLAVAVIGGLLFSTVITLVVIPVNYAIFEDFKEKRKLKKSQKKAAKAI